MKAKGADLIRFWKEWPCGDDFYHDDYNPDLYDGEGEPEIDPTAEIDVGDFLGNLQWQGHGDPPGHITVSGRKVPVRDGIIDPYTLYEAWAISGNHVQVTVSLDPKDMDTFKALCEQHGWEIST